MSASALQVFVLLEGQLLASEVFGDGIYTLGRDAKCDLVLEHEMISPVHASLRLSEGRATLVDQGGAVGTVVNGRPIRAQVVTSADDIYLGPFLLKLRSLVRKEAVSSEPARGASPAAGSPVVGQRSAPQPPAAVQPRAPSPLIPPPRPVAPSAAQSRPLAAGRGTASLVAIPRPPEWADDDAEVEALVGALDSSNPPRPAAPPRLAPVPAVVDAPPDDQRVYRNAVALELEPEVTPKLIPEVTPLLRPEFIPELTPQVTPRSDIVWPPAPDRGGALRPPGPVPAPRTEAPRAPVQPPRPAARPGSDATLPAAIPPPSAGGPPMRPAAPKVAAVAAAPPGTALAPPTMRPAVPPGTPQAAAALQPPAPAARAPVPAPPLGPTSPRQGVGSAGIAPPRPASPPASATAAAPLPPPTSAAPLPSPTSAAPLPPPAAPLPSPTPAAPPASASRGPAVVPPAAFVRAPPPPASASESAATPSPPDAWSGAERTPLLDARSAAAFAAAVLPARGVEGLFVRTLWGRQQISESFFTPGQSVVAGPEEDAAVPLYGFGLSGATTLARAAAYGWAVHVPRRATVSVRGPSGRWEESKDGAAGPLPIPSGGAVRLTVGQLVIELARERAHSEAVRRVARPDPVFSAILLVLAVAAAVFVVTMPLEPKTVAAPDIERFAKYMTAMKERAKPPRPKNQPTPEKQVEKPPPKPIAQAETLKAATAQLRAVDQVTSATRQIDNVLAALNKLSVSKGPDRHEKPGISELPSIPNLGNLTTPSAIGDLGGNNGPLTKGLSALNGAGLLGSGTAGRGKVRGVPVTVPKKPTQVQGQIDRDALARVINDHVDEMRSCYERALLRDPNIGAGKVTLEWTIGPAGAVTEIATKTSTLRSSEVVSCLLGVVRALQFPRPQGGVVIVSYPILFNSVGY